MRKRKIPHPQMYYWIAFLSDDDDAKGLDLLGKDGPIHGRDFGYYIVGVWVSEAQCRKLTRAKIKWEYAETLRQKAEQERHVVQFKTLRGYGRGVDIAAQFGAVHCRPKNLVLITGRQLEAIRQTRLHFTVLSDTKKTQIKSRVKAT